MYRAFLWPRKFHETDAEGKIRHLNLETGKPADGVLYVDNGFWDTYRTLYPYLSVIDTKLYAEMAEGYYHYYEDSGWLPKWLCPDNFNCMPGMLVEATMADAVVKEIVGGELSEKIFQALLHDGESFSGEAGVGRVAAEEYRALGYVPYTAAKESVNETLDCCYGDYCICQSGGKIGHGEEPKSISAMRRIIGTYSIRRRGSCAAGTKRGISATRFSIATHGVGIIRRVRRGRALLPSITIFRA